MDMAEVIGLKRKGKPDMADPTITVSPPKPLRISVVVHLTHRASIRIFPDEWRTIVEEGWSNGHSDDPDH